MATASQEPHALEEPAQVLGHVSANAGFAPEATLVEQVRNEGRRYFEKVWSMLAGEPARPRARSKGCGLSERFRGRRSGSAERASEPLESLAPRAPTIQQYLFQAELPQCPGPAQTTALERLP